MRFTKAGPMKAMDTYAIEVLHIPSEILMERAAAGAVAVAETMLKSGGTVTVYCGSGNNGGDGIAMARLLRRRGYRVHCVLVGDADKLTADSRRMVERYRMYGGVLESYGAEAPIPLGTELLVDALFGTGLAREVGGKYRTLIAAMNASGIPVLACDIASGVSADTGEVLGIAVHAAVTVTFNLPKTGQLLPPGTAYTGRLIVHDIGIPEAAKAQTIFDGTYVTEEVARSWLPGKRQLETHKGDYGKLLLLCGSTGFTGAAAMAARAALRSGAGLLFLGVPKAVYPILAAKLDEAIVFPLPCDEAGQLAQAAVPEVLARLPGMDACLAGPGLGVGAGVSAVVRELLVHATCPLVLDADGINVLAGHIDELDRTHVPVVLTPHDGEFRRLGGDTAADRLTGTRALADRTGAVVVRKGYRTITAAPAGECYVNSTGNPGMATGGSGDVLSGILTCLLGQGMAPEKAAAAAVWLHGAAGDLAAKRLGETGMLPTDMIDALPEIL